MQDSGLKLAKRLDEIWRQADFSSVFKKFANTPLKSFKKGQIIFYEGDESGKIYFIKEGFVKLFRSSAEGRDTIVYLYGPGSVLGLRLLTTPGHIFRHSAEALTEVKIQTMPSERLFEIFKENPEYIIDFMHLFIDRLNYTEHKLEGFILTDATARVASFLSGIAERFGKRRGSKISLPLLLTHQRIAEFVGIYRETVTVAMLRLAREKVLVDRRGQIIILNLRKLKKLALL